MSQIAGAIGHPHATMNFYSTLVGLHVVTAIFGLGPLASLAAATTRSSSASIPPERVARLMGVVRWGLLGMFLTGAGIIALTHGAFGETIWMRASFGLFVLLGLLHGARQPPAPAGATRDAVDSARGLSTMLWVMCAVVVTITYCRVDCRPAGGSARSARTGVGGAARESARGDEKRLEGSCRRTQGGGLEGGRGGIAEATTGLCQRLAGCAPAHGRGIRRQPLRLRNASRRTAERTGRLRAPNRKDKVMTPFQPPRW